MTWFLIVSMAVITFLNRYAFFAEFLSYQPGARAKRFLSYSTYAVLTAIWAPIVFQFDQQQGISNAGLDYLIAGSLAALLSLMQVRSIVVVLSSSALFFLLRFPLLNG